MNDLTYEDLIKYLKSIVHRAANYDSDTYMEISNMSIDFIDNSFVKRYQFKMCAIAFCYEIWECINKDTSQHALVALDVVQQLPFDKDAHRYISNLIYSNREYYQENFINYMEYPAHAALSEAATLCHPESHGYSLSKMLSDCATWARKAAVWGPYEEDVIEARQVQIIKSFAHRQYPGEWKNKNTQSLAQQIYKRKLFHNMPVLADMLEENGCTDAELLNQLRDAEFPHYRGSCILEFLK